MRWTYIIKTAGKTAKDVSMKRNVTWAAVIAALVFTLVFAGCGGGKKSGETSGGTSGGTPEVKQAANAASTALKALQGTDPAAIVQALSGLDVAGLLSLTRTNGSPSGDFSYDLNDAGDGIVIRRYSGQGGAVIVPATIEDIPVVEIGDSSFFNNLTVVAVVLPATIMKIGDYAFAGVNYLAAINLPDGLNKIGEFAFAITSLTSVTIPEGTEIIGGAAFQGCKKLLSVTFPASIKEIYGGNTINLSTYVITQFGAFEGCSELADIIIPDSVTSIEWRRSFFATSDPEDVFQGCGKLKLAVRQRLKDLGYTGKF
jgi:hypothetical protein